MYSYFYPSEDFLNFIKKLENESMEGFSQSKKVWFPHPSIEGGLPTIAYGHKIRKRELDTMKRGISQST